MSKSHGVVVLDDVQPQHFFFQPLCNTSIKYCRCSEARQAILSSSFFLNVYNKAKSDEAKRMMMIMGRSQGESF